MPNYKVHDGINLACLAGLVVAGIYYRIGYIDIILFSVAFVFATRYLSPDMDIDSVIYRRWGLLRFAWWPYKMLMKHRGMSHHLIMGPISLIGYLVAWIALLIYAACGTSLEYDVKMIIVLAGMVTAIELHIFVDILASLRK